MPYGDANAIVMEMANEVIPVVKQTPVLAGVCGTDPFRRMDLFLKQVQDAGFAGVQNFPTVGLIDGNYRINLELQQRMYFPKMLKCGVVSFTVDKSETEPRCRLARG